MILEAFSNLGDSMNHTVFLGVFFSFFFFFKLNAYFININLVIYCEIVKLTTLGATRSLLHFYISHCIKMYNRAPDVTSFHC